MMKNETITYITELEKLKLDEKEIVTACIELARDCEYNREMILTINECLNEKGYRYQFMLPPDNKESFDNTKYFSLVKNASKSTNKTLDLINYLRSIKDSRLVLVSLHCLKVSRLIKLSLIPNTDFYIEHENDNLYDLFFTYYQQVDVHHELCSTLKSIGIQYINEDFMQFRLDMEYLIYSMNKKDKSKDLFKKQNTIRVAFAIAPKIFFINDDKIYFEPKISKKLMSYLKLIDKTLIEEMKNKYAQSIENIETQNGYKVLYYSLYSL